jgi:signal transduction histidine kinase
VVADIASVLTSGLWRTTTFRLSALFGLLYAMGIVLLLGLVYVQTAAYLTQRSDQALRAEVKILERDGPDKILRRFERESAHDPLSRFALYAATGERVAGDSPLTPTNLPLDGVGRNVRLPGGMPARALATRTPWGEILIVERDTRPILELRHIVLGALVWSGAIIVILGLASGIGLSLRPLARIQAMQAASDRIASGDFSSRLPIAGNRDELDELARIANRMMDEAERLMIQARTVGEAVAHELRSPLTRLRTTLDHAAQGLESDDLRRRLLDRCVSETDGVLTRFRALLRIAALEARGRGLGMSPVRLDAIAHQIGELYAPLARDQGLDLTIANGVEITIDADGELIFEALSNLVDNALKFTGKGGKVTVSVTASPEGATLEVTDNGPGIPEAERAFVTKRFYRGQRHAGVTGHGLGLSLVAAVADLHGFQLDFGDGHPGAVVRLKCAAPQIR